MTQEDKQLLLKDLCARLPYSTLCYCKWAKDAPNGTSGYIDEVSTYYIEELVIIGNPKYECQICEIKPYLRPMSSMTEEENKQRKEFGILLWSDSNGKRGFNGFGNISGEDTLKAIEWLNTHHFDYRGLIEKGLALEVPKGMYK